MTADRDRAKVLDEIHGACPYCTFGLPPRRDSLFGGHDTRCEQGMALERAYDAGAAAVLAWLNDQA